MIFQRPVLIQTFNTEQKWNICWKDPVRHNQNLLFRPSLTIPHGRGQYLHCLKFTVYKLKYLQRHERHHAWSGRAKAAKYWKHTQAMCMCVFVLQECWNCTEIQIFFYRNTFAYIIQMFAFSSTRQCILDCLISENSNCKHVNWLLNSICNKSCSNDAFWLSPWFFKTF